MADDSLVIGIDVEARRSPAASWTSATAPSGTASSNRRGPTRRRPRARRRRGDRVQARRRHAAHLDPPAAWRRRLRARRPSGAITSGRPWIGAISMWSAPSRGWDRPRSRRTSGPARRPRPGSARDGASIRSCTCRWAPGSAPRWCWAATLRGPARSALVAASGTFSTTCPHCGELVGWCPRTSRPGSAWCGACALTAPTRRSMARRTCSPPPTRRRRRARDRR